MPANVEFRPLSAAAYRARCAGIRLALFDVDGVMTDGRLWLGPRGEELKVFHSRDGQGLALLRQAGIAFGVVSGRSSPAVAERLDALGAAWVVQGCQDKRAAVQAIQANAGVSAAQTAFLADDWPDIPALLSVGLAVAVADADPGILGCCHWRTRTAGGLGAVRELCEDLLDARGALAPLHRALLGGPDAS